MSDQKEPGQALKDFLASSLHPKPAAPKAPEPEPAPEPVPAPEPAVAPAPEPVPVAEPKPVARRQKVDPEAIAQEAARLATEQMKDAPPAPPAPAVVVEIPEDYKHRYEVIKYLATKNPKYADLPARYEKFMKAEQAYIQKWVNDHNGEEFDGADPAHNEFYDKNLPKYSEADFRRAEISIEAEKIANEKGKEFDAKIQKIEEEKVIAGLGRQITDARSATISEVADAIAPTMKEKFKTQAGFKEVEEEDPLIADAVLRGASAVTPMVDAAVQLYRSGGAVKFNPDNAAHSELAALALDLEKTISSLPARERADNEGRMFATREGWSRMSDEQKSRHWFIGEEEIMFALTQQARATALEFYEGEQARFKKYSKKLAPAAPAPAPKPAAAPSGGGDRVVTLKGTTPKPAKTFGDVLASKMFPGKG